jgi:hypothetical protein
MDVVVHADMPKAWAELPIARLEWTNVQGGHGPSPHPGYAVGPIVSSGGSDLAAAIERAAALSASGFRPVAVGVLQASDGVLWLAKLGTKLHGVDANAYWFPGDDRLVISAAAPVVDSLQAIVSGTGLVVEFPDAPAGSNVHDARVLVPYSR